MSQATVSGFINGTERIFAVVNIAAAIAAGNDAVTCEFERPIKLDPNTAVRLTTVNSVSGTATASVGFIKHDRPTAQ